MALRLSLAPVLVASLVSTLQAQTPSTSRETTGADAGKVLTETKHLKLVASANPRSAAAGGRVSLYVDVEPKPKMHVYAPDQKDNIPITLTLAADESFRAQPVRYPASEKYFFAPLKETQQVFSRPFRLEQPITLAAATSGKEVTITGTVRYQACDDAICYVPQNVPVTWTIRVKR
jgi:DsbC/DsbD-like thiol-disulfide interchange protein